MAAFLLSGCQSQRSIVGVWDTRAELGRGTMTFRDDHTFHHMRETPMATLTLDGTYELNGSSLRLHVVKWGVPKGPPITPEIKLAMNREFQTDAISNVEWTDEDHIKIVSPQGELTTGERVRK